MPHKTFSDTGAAGLEKFMRRWNLGPDEAGNALGVTRRMIYWYLNGRHAIPRSIGLLIQALEENWRRKK